MYHRHCRPWLCGWRTPGSAAQRLPFVSAAALLLRGGCCGEVRRRGRGRARGVTRSQLRQCRPRGRREQRRSRSSSAWVEGRAAPSKCTVPMPPAPAWPELPGQHQASVCCGT
eukprot:scaffold492_cov347-Prasinococcus_capsulatus_cf.AAC.8